MDRFIDLAGGPAARIVILPGAGEQDTFPDDWSGFRPFREAGVRKLTVLHTHRGGDVRRARARRSEAEVIGRSKAAFYNTADAAGAPYYFPEAGDVFDLARRRRMR